MSKIYVVTRGDYSDYSIVGVFSTRKKAKIVEDKYNDCHIETYELDEISDIFEQGYDVYYVSLYINGTIREVKSADLWNLIEHAVDTKIYLFGDNLTCWTICKAKSREAAIKIAGERLAQYIAKKGI